MKQAQIELGKVYKIRIGGYLTTVRVETQNGRWFQGQNIKTGRTLRFTAAKLRGEVS